MNMCRLVIVLSLFPLYALAYDDSLVDHYQRELALNPNNFVTHFQLAGELFKYNDLDGAMEHYKKAIAICAALPSAHFNLGVTLQAKGLKDEAYQEYLEVLKYSPDHIKARNRVIDYLENKEQYDQAVEHSKIILEVEPLNRDLRHRIANFYNFLCRFDDSMIEFRKALLLDPKHGQTLLDYANTLNMMGYPEIAYEFYQAINDAGIKSLSVTYNIAYTLKKLGKYDESIRLCNEVLQQSADYAPAHFALATSHLVLGNLAAGWKEYEWRWKQGMLTERHYKEPLWDGSDLTGKTLFVHAEQGLGDTFQFIRYAQVAKDRGGYIVAAVQSPLVKLLERCPYIDKVITLGSQPAHFDYQIPLLTFPLVLNTVLETIPNKFPYIFSDPTLDDYWREKLQSDKNFKIGVCWQGNPNYSTHFLRVAVASKSLRPAEFAPLGNVKGISIYSLQKEHACNVDETLPEGFKIYTFDETFDKDHGRFMDTVSVMKNLDLVITVDTSICHLAGALGVPVWVVLPRPADWRWLLNRTDSPWYPTMRLFRQTIIGNWSMVIDDVITALEPLVKEHYEAEYA